MKRILLISAGVVCLVLGGIGIALPLLPTTPFVLLAAACFSASSPAMYRRLLKHRYFGEYIRNYRSGAGISEAARWKGIGFLWLMLSISAYFVQKLYVWIILAAVGIGVTIHLLTIRAKTSKPVNVPDTVN